MPSPEPPWGPDMEFPAEHDCVRCGGRIPENWRHFWRLCSCTYLPADQPPHMADPACPACGGTGYLPCEPQDLSILRRWGYCSTCGAAAFVLVRATGEVGEIEGSARHVGESDHEVPAVVAGPLVKTVGDYLDRATAGGDDR